MSERLVDVQSIAEAKALRNANLPHTAKIQADTSALDAAGGRVPTWSDPAAVACRLVPLGAPIEGAPSDQRKPSAQYVCKFAAGTDVTSRNRLVVTTETEVKTLMIVGVQESEISVQAFCRDAAPSEL